MTPSTEQPPSQRWRLVLSTPGGPVYSRQRSKPAAYRAVEAEKRAVAEGESRVVRIAVEYWDSGRWMRYENVWDKNNEQTKEDR